VPYCRTGSKLEGINCPGSFVNSYRHSETEISVHCQPDLVFYVPGSPYVNKLRNGAHQNNSGMLARILCLTFNQGTL
jgi:hypothetical protein